MIKLFTISLFLFLILNCKDNSSTVANVLSPLDSLLPIDSLVSVQISSTDTILNIDSTVQLSAVVTTVTEDSTSLLVTWSSSDTNIATVNSGLVVGKSLGTATITARSVLDSTKTASVTIEVESVLPPLDSLLPIDSLVSVQISPTDTILNIDSTVQLSAVVTTVTEDSTSLLVTWSSSDTSIATVNSGLVVGKSLGTATITARSVLDSTKTASVTIEVESVMNMSISFENDIKPIFTSSCWCHLNMSSNGSGTANGGDNVRLELDDSNAVWSSVVGVKSYNYGAPNNYIRIVAGNPDSSVLYQKILSSSNRVLEVGGRMPLGGSLSEAQIKAIKDWILGL